MIQLNKHPLKYARHPLVYLVEAADDICYQMMDLEDAHKLKILSTEETKKLLLSYFPKEKRTHREETLKLVSDTNEQIAYLRSSVIGLLIKECTKAFLENEANILNGTFTGSLIQHISPITAQAYHHCAKLSFEKIYSSRDVLDVELAGFRIITTLLDLMIEAVCSPEKAYSQLLINRVSSQYNIRATSLFERIQAVLDYVSGMTDVFALDLYRKINGNSLPAV
ncbi:dGTPase [gut metagenome]|uniref:dGTPase n=1 Tax=gut metagenome TaxID=749906 RepID=J9GRQ4_9ZZZZ